MAVDAAATAARNAPRAKLVQAHAGTGHTHNTDPHTYCTSYPLADLIANSRLAPFSHTPETVAACRRRTGESVAHTQRQGAADPRKKDRVSAVCQLVSSPAADGAHDASDTDTSQVAAVESARRDTQQLTGDSLAGAACNRGRDELAGARRHDLCADRPVLLPDPVGDPCHVPAVRSAAAACHAAWHGLLSAGPRAPSVEQRAGSGCAGRPCRPRPPADAFAPALDAAAQLRPGFAPPALFPRGRHALDVRHKRKLVQRLSCRVWTRCRRSAAQCARRACDTRRDGRGH